MVIDSHDCGLDHGEVILDGEGRKIRVVLQPDGEEGIFGTLSDMYGSEDLFGLFSFRRGDGAVGSLTVAFFMELRMLFWLNSSRMERETPLSVKVESSREPSCWRALRMTLFLQYWGRKPRRWA